MPPTVSKLTAPELLAPAGNWECARAAVANGADAIFFGLPQFNARLRADNITLEELPDLMRFLHDHGVRGYVTLNTLAFTSELSDVEKLLRTMEASGVDSIIVQDLGVVRLAQTVAPRIQIHASTQMSITSAEGVAFAKKLGAKRVVLARELSLQELEKFGETLPLEVFVHGALCVAYSGQCLTSEALGQRSANRGECAQACRLPYELIVDGVLRDLGDKRYLLSPQDLAAIEEVPELIARGIACFKIEGRLKTPEYVAAITQVYRQAIDAALGRTPITPEQKAKNRYQMEMAFSRGLYSGWMHGVNHQELVHARFGKKRGAFAGFITAVGPDCVTVKLETPVKPGDGVVFDTGGNTEFEQGGRLWQVRGDRLFFEREKIRFSELKPGHRVWKTDDPQLNKELRQSFTSEIPKKTEGLTFTVSGKARIPLTLSTVWQNQTVEVRSPIPLEAARNRPLTDETLKEQLGRLGETPFHLEKLVNLLEGNVILPVKELNQLRRDLVEKLEQIPPAPSSSIPASTETLQTLLSKIPKDHSIVTAPELVVLCRTPDQIEAALNCGIKTIYVDYEDIRRGKEAVAQVRAHGNASVFLATPRIQKAGEIGFFRVIEQAAPDGVLIRNLGGIDFFRDKPFRRVGDFSLNVANPLTAAILMEEPLEHLTISYDLNARQVLDLLAAAPPTWFELTIHQHLPMFHMEHCVFAAFLSKGTDATNCGRPCEKHQVTLRDRVGMEHPLKADVGCRNTVYHGKSQTGAAYYQEFLAAGLRIFRIELLNESGSEARNVFRVYQSLLNGSIDMATLNQQIKAVNQLGVTNGTLTVLS